MWLFEVVKQGWVYGSGTGPSYLGVDLLIGWVEHAEAKLDAEQVPQRTVQVLGQSRESTFTYSDFQRERAGRLSQGSVHMDFNSKFRLRLAMKWALTYRISDLAGLIGRHHVALVEGPTVQLSWQHQGAKVSNLAQRG